MTTEEIIKCELEDLARLFEGNPDCVWTGSDVAAALRERIKNHHFIAMAKREPSWADRL